MNKLSAWLGKGSIWAAWISLRRVMLLGLLFQTSSTLSGDMVFTEYQVKALFLFNFAKYVDWPAGSFSATNAPITIGLLGQDHFNDDLNRIVEGKSINGRAILIKHIATDADLDSCQILFISSSENSRLDEILGKTGALPIVTVGEQDQFCQKGGIINFTVKDKKVRLEVNLNAARQAKVQISSKLLSVADVVRGKSN